MKWWRHYLRGTWAIARHGGRPSLVLADLAAGIRWYARLRSDRRNT